MCVVCLVSNLRFVDTAENDHSHFCVFILLFHSRIRSYVCSVQCVCALVCVFCCCCQEPFEAITGWMCSSFAIQLVFFLLFDASHALSLSRPLLLLIQFRFENNPTCSKPKKKNTRTNITSKSIELIMRHYLCLLGRREREIKSRYVLKLFIIYLNVAGSLNAIHRSFVIKG